MVHLTAYSYHVMYAFLELIQLYGSLNVMELLAQVQVRYLKLKSIQRDSNPQPLSS